MPPPLPPQTTDQLLLILAEATPPPPHHWEWPTAAFPPDLQDAAALLGRSLLADGTILTVREDGQLYRWATNTLDGEPMEPQSPPNAPDLKRHTILKWLRANTPPNEWWSLKRRFVIGTPGDKFVKARDKKYERNPIHDAMEAAGISYSAAYMTMVRACELGLAIKAERQTPLFGHWKWTQLGRGVTNDFEIQDLIERYARLPESRQLAFINCISTKPLGVPTVKNGDYEFRIISLDMSPFLALRGTLFYKGQMAYNSILPIEDVDRATSDYAQQANAWAAGQGLGTVRPATSPVLHEPSADEIEAAAIAQHRAEMAELAAADFDYDDPTGESE